MSNSVATNRIVPLPVQLKKQTPRHTGRRSHNLGSNLYKNYARGETKT